MADGGDANAYALQITEKQQDIADRLAKSKNVDAALREEAYKQVALGPYIRAMIAEESPLTLDDAVPPRAGANFGGLVGVRRAADRMQQRRVVGRLPLQAGRTGRLGEAAGDQAGVQRMLERETAAEVGGERQRREKLRRCRCRICHGIVTGAIVTGLWST